MRLAATNQQPSTPFLHFLEMDTRLTRHLYRLQPPIRHSNSLTYLRIIEIAY